MKHDLHQPFRGRLATAAALGGLIAVSTVLAQSDGLPDSLPPAGDDPATSVAAAAVPVAVAVGDAADVALATAPPVDLVICLDTSGSMEGLIDAARQRIWAVVNDLALAEPTPTLRVALLSYGNNGHDAEIGWVKVHSDLTTDLDLISQELFGLRTNGGEEYVGRVVRAAADQLDWHPSEEALKLIVVAGNESADQDPTVAFREACTAAIGRGIMVNAIYCGDEADDLAPGWREVARLADGRFASIDHNATAVTIATPFDTRLGELSAAINTTFVPHTEAGWTASRNQLGQDANAESINDEIVAQRCVTKGSTIYVQQWDLVSAWMAGEVTLEKLERDKLPEAMRELDDAALVARLTELAAERTAMQNEIRALGLKREAFVTAEKARLAIDDSQTLDFVLRQAIREQAAACGIRVMGPAVAVGAVSEVPAEEEAEPMGPDQNQAEAGGDGC